MIPDFLQSSEPRQLGIWVPVLAVILVFLGFNMRIEVKIQKDEDQE